jgi:hypothetical protein
MTRKNIHSTRNLQSRVSRSPFDDIQISNDYGIENSGRGIESSDSESSDIDSSENENESESVINNGNLTSFLAERILDGEDNFTLKIIDYVLFAETMISKIWIDINNLRNRCTDSKEFTIFLLYLFPEYLQLSDVDNIREIANDYCNSGCRYY